LIAAYQCRDAEDEHRDLLLGLSAQDLRYAEGLKLGLYGLNTLSELKPAFEIMTNKPPEQSKFWFDSTAFNDGELIEHMIDESMGSIGVLQLSHKETLSFVSQVSPKNFDDITNTLSVCARGLFKDPELASDFIARRVEVPEALLAFDGVVELLKPTRNLLMFNEQAYYLLTEVAGMSAEDAVGLIHQVANRSGADGITRLKSALDETKCTSCVIDAIMCLFERTGHRLIFRAYVFTYACMTYLSRWVRKNGDPSLLLSTINTSLRTTSGVVDCLRYMLALGIPIAGVSEEDLERLKFEIIDGVWHPQGKNKQLKEAELDRWGRKLDRKHLRYR